MDWTFYMLIGVTLALGSTIQAATGFAFGLFSITLLLLLGMPAWEAIPIVAVGAFAQIIVGIWHHWRDVDWRSLFGFAAIGILTQPVGVWVLHQLTTNAKAWVKPTFGVVVLAAVLATWLIKPTPHKRLHPGWGVAAFGIGGAMQGLAGMGGPPIVLWVMSHDWSSRVCRATLWSFFIMMIPTNLLFFWLRFGDAVIGAMGVGVLYIPLVMLAALPGMWIGNKIPKRELQQIAFGILVLMAIYAMAQPLLLPDA